MSRTIQAKGFTDKVIGKETGSTNDSIPDEQLPDSLTTLAFPSAGRSDFILLEEPLTDTAGNLFPVMYRKGVGVVRQKLHPEDEDKLFGRPGPGGLPEKSYPIIGDTKRKGYTSDVAVTKVWQQAGLRVRTPYTYFELETFFDGDEAKKIKKESNPSIISAWATRNPMTFADLTEIMTSLKEKKNPKLIFNQILRSQAYFLGFEKNDPQAVELSKQLLDKPEEHVYEWLDWLTTGYGKQTGIKTAAGLFSDELHRQNLGLGVEWRDLADTPNNPKYLNYKSNPIPYDQIKDEELKELLLEEIYQVLGALLDVNVSLNIIYDQESHHNINLTINKFLESLEKGAPEMYTVIAEDLKKHYSSEYLLSNRSMYGMSNSYELFYDFKSDNGRSHIPEVVKSIIQGSTDISYEDYLENYQNYLENMPKKTILDKLNFKWNYTMFYLDQFLDEIRQTKIIPAVNMFIERSNLWAAYQDQFYLSSSQSVAKAVRLATTAISSIVGIAALTIFITVSFVSTVMAQTPIQSISTTLVAPTHEVELSQISETVFDVEDNQDIIREQPASVTKDNLLPPVTEIFLDTTSPYEGYADSETAPNGGRIFTDSSQEYLPVAAADLPPTSFTKIRSRENLLKTIDWFNLTLSSRYQSQMDGPADSRYVKTSYCNIWAWDLSRALGVELPRYASQYGEGVSKTDANWLYLWLTGEGMDRYRWEGGQGSDAGWNEISAKQVPEFVDQGQPVVGVTYNPNLQASGHIVFAMPGEGETIDNQFYPSVANVGAVTATDISAYEAFEGWLNDPATPEEYKTIRYFANKGRYEIVNP